MKRTIAVARVELLKEWLYSVYANNGCYYCATLATCIPDGEELPEVMSDLQDGFYDDDIDSMISTYRRCRSRFGKDGYYYNGWVFHDPDDCLDAAGYVFPDRILKNGKYNIRMVVDWCDAE